MISRPNVSAPTAVHAAASPCDQQLLTLFHTLHPDQREIIVLLVSRWASQDDRAGLSLIHPRRIA